MITGKILKLRGWPEGKIIGLAKAAAEILAQTEPDQEAILLKLDLVRLLPAEYVNDPVLGDLARECQRRAAPKIMTEALRDQPLPYSTWGADQIDPGARAQMENALRLPVAVAGALMPDAHVGYGLPIGGVLATDNAVIPYAVGVDIACRMRLSVYPVSPITLGQRRNDFKRSLLTRTRFGQGESWERNDRPEHPVLDDPAWDATRLLKSLHIKAEQQLGTSGSG